MGKRTIPYIPGDGIGPEIVEATRCVVNAAVKAAYGSEKKINWLPVLAGKAAYESENTFLPDGTLDAIRRYKVAIKGPLTTPIGGGIRSLNVALRQKLDLFVCQRPVRWLEGLPSPHKSPKGIDIVIFRENTEDLYAGIEYEAGKPDHHLFMQAYQGALPSDYKKLPNPSECGIGIKPISKTNSQRLVRATLNWAIANNRKRVTLVHKGNIMKFTEGAFMKWGYEEAENNFASRVFTSRYYHQIARSISSVAADEAKNAALKNGKIWVDDVIADIVFEQLITYPQQFDVVATTNLNGDYISDAAAALAGGVGISPGANINYTSGMALFEANHGSALAIAGQDKANPSSLILSAVMMLRFINWDKAADLIHKGLADVILEKQVTLDLAAQIGGASTLGTQAFADKIIKKLMEA